MKKGILTFAFLIAMQFSFSQVNEALKKDAIKVIEISGSANQMLFAKKQILAMIPEKNKEAFSKEFDASMPALYDKMADLYVKTYSKEEIKFMLDYFESPIGKKIAEKAVVLTEESMNLGKEWAKGLEPMMMKYMGE